MQCDQFKELLKDKEEEIQTLIQELDNGRTQSLDQDEMGMMNNQVYILMEIDIFKHLLGKIYCVKDLSICLFLT